MKPCIRPSTSQGLMDCVTGCWACIWFCDGRLCSRPVVSFNFAWRQKNACVIFLAALGNKTQHQLQLCRYINLSLSCCAYSCLFLLKDGENSIWGSIYKHKQETVSIKYLWYIYISSLWCACLYNVKTNKQIFSSDLCLISYLNRYKKKKET